MLRSERFDRWCLAVGEAVRLCRPLMLAGARASAAPTQEVSALVILPAAVQFMAMESDCIPCALCYVAQRVRRLRSSSLAKRKST